VSITPLPRGIQQTSAISLTGGAVSKLPSGVSPGMKPGQNPNATNKTSFVICEICDGYIKDLDQLRNHMQWIHKVKVSVGNKIKELFHTKQTGFYSRSGGELLESVDFWKKAIFFKIWVKNQLL
jgi:hypothetical protein